MICNLGKIRVSTFILERAREIFSNIFISSSYIGNRNGAKVVTIVIGNTMILTYGTKNKLYIILRIFIWWKL